MANQQGTLITLLLAGGITINFKILFLFSLSAIYSQGFTTTTTIDSISLFHYHTTIYPTRHNRDATGTTLLAVERQSESSPPSLSSAKDKLLSWALSPKEEEDVDNENRNNEETPPILVDILPSTIGKNDVGNGLFVTKAIKKNEKIMVIPSHKTITIEDAWDDPELGDSFMYLTDIGGPGAKLASLAGFVAKEFHGGSIIQTMMCHRDDDFSREKTAGSTTSSSDSRWKAYFECLPSYWNDKEEEEQDHHHVLWWSNEKVERLLKGSIVYDEVVSMREQVDIAIENLQSIFWSHYYNDLEDREDLKEVFENDGDDEDNKVTIDGKIANSVRSAFCTILSRAFEDDDFDCMKIIPVLDMTQHCDDDKRVNIRHETDPTTGDICVRAKRDLLEGEELFNCYSKTLDPHQYLTVFGFVPNDKGLNAIELLEGKDATFFPDNTTS